MKKLFLKLTIFLFSFSLPLFLLLILAGRVPSAFDVSSLDEWSPIRSPGVSTLFLAKGFTFISGIENTQHPEWFNEEDRTTLTEIKKNLTNNHIQQAAGHLMILAGRLEEQQKTWEDFLFLIIPELSTWFLANYFTPILMVLLFVILGLFLFGQWLMKRFYDFIKLLITFLFTLIVVGIGVSVCFAIASKKSLMFVLIEYLTFSLLIWMTMNFVVWCVLHRKSKRLHKNKGRVLQEIGKSRQKGGEIVPYHQSVDYDSENNLLRKHQSFYDNISLIAIRSEYEPNNRTHDMPLLIPV